MTERKLFKYYLEQKENVKSTELLYRRFNRWRQDTSMYPKATGKKGAFFGMMKYGVFMVAAYHLG